MILDSFPLITIMTLNLRFGLADDGPNGWSFRKHAFAQLLGRFPLDFLCLQEVNDFQARDVSTMLPGFRCIGLRSPAPRFWQNNLIYYRFGWRCDFEDHFFLSPTPDIPSRFRESRWPRQCTWGRFGKEGRYLDLVTTHFDFDEVVQKKMARVLLKRLNGNRGSGPTVITGDFNAVPGSGPFRLLTAGDGGGEHDFGRFASVFTQPFPGTHHRYQGQSDGRHIDWILYKGRLCVRDKGIISRRIGGRFLSDHFPLWVKFSVVQEDSGP